MRYRKRPLEIEAILWTGFNLEPVAEFLGETPEFTWDVNGSRGIMLQTLEGKIVASQGDYIIRGIKGELYPCKPDIFESTYEAVDTG